MTSEQSVVLQLINKAVDSSFALSIDNSVNWNDVIEFAQIHGVTGICLDSICSLYESSIAHNSSGEMQIVSWFAYTHILERSYVACKHAINNLNRLFYQNDISMLLLKGYGLSLYWPKPNHRPCGDIDIYLFGKWKDADTLVSTEYGIEIDTEHEHHTCYSFEGFSIENHYDIVDAKATKSGALIDAKLKELSQNYQVLSDTKIYLPKADFNALFLIRHLGQHFAGAEASLRQLLDWGFFIQAESKNVNWNDIIPFYKCVGLYDFFCCINSICVTYLGFKKELFPFSSNNNELVKRIFDDILHPEFDKQIPKNNKFAAIIVKLRRFFANRWKRKLVYKEGLLSQLFMGTISHLRRWETIQD